MAKNKFSFGLKMWALKKAREILKKEQREIDERYLPVSPLPETPKAEGKAIEATAITPIIKYIKEPNALESAIQHLREQASKIK